MLKKTLLLTPLLFISVASFANTLSVRHGYIDNPPSRAMLCSSLGGNLNKSCGAVQYEPQSVEGLKGFPASGPKDGEIASGGIASFSELNQQSKDRWHKINMQSGENTFTWTLTAAHSTTSWQFFITKQNWNPDKPLTRDSFELKPFCERQDRGKIPAKSVKLKCIVPERTGYQAILGVWTIADTPNAFYQVIDADMKK